MVLNTLHLPPPERSGGKERKRGGNHAGNEETRAALVRLDPGDPRCDDGKQENGGDRAGHQRAEDQTEPAPASWCLLRGVSAPVVHNRTWYLPDVSEYVDCEH